MPCDSTPRSLLALILKSLGSTAPGQRKRHLVADFVILRAADDLPRLAGAIVHLANAQPVGIRMLRRCDDLRDDHMVEVRAARFDAFDLDAGQGEQVGQLPDVVGQFDKFTEPVEENFMARPLAEPIVAGMGLS